MSQFFNPYAFQNSYMMDENKRRNLFNMNRLGEMPITKSQFDKGNNLVYNVHENTGTQLGSVSPHTGMGVSTVYAPAQANPSVPYGFSGSPMQDSSVVPKAIGVAPTVGNSTMSDAPKKLDFTNYSKSMDKTFAMAALQSAIPQNQPAPSGGVRGAGRKVGGGDRSSQMTPFNSALKPKEEEYPALWRYGMGGR